MTDVFSRFPEILFGQAVEPLEREHFSGNWEFFLEKGAIGGLIVMHKGLCE
ncbi:hypothetical protein QQ054_13740 [Oscillatoria amoena NRMC-F 0135]|nr:hypothetical protein [Oscillatoria amoena NRMC-F 0135]